ncbi:MAG: hypothetical protein ACR2PS_11070 [Pseudomonadales bacterium]
MKLDQMYPSKYIKADDLGNARVTVTVQAVVFEDIGNNEMKPVMKFMAHDKGMVLNKTNATLCGSIWGDETDTWQGKTLDLFAAPVMFQGKSVMGLSVAPHMPTANTPAPQQSMSEQRASANSPESPFANAAPDWDTPAQAPYDKPDDLARPAAANTDAAKRPPEDDIPF